MRYILAAAWIFWAICLAYSTWSYKRVFPVFVSIEAERELTLSYLPSDTYAVSLTIGLSPDEANTPNGPMRLIDELRSNLDAYPIDLNLLILDSQGKEVVRHDGGGDKWYVGTRHSFDEHWTFDQVIVIFNAIEFEGKTLDTYRLQYSVETENPSIEDREMNLLVAGKRDNGYYPLVVMVYMGLSFLALLFVTIVRILFRIPAARDG